MTTNQEEITINTKIALLPMASIEKALEIQSETLLIYEKKGILNPEEKMSGRRYYSLDDLEKAKLARLLTKEKAMQLRGVKILLSILEKFNIKLKSCFDYVQEITNTN